MAHSDFSKSLFSADGRAFLNDVARPPVHQLETHQLLLLSVLLGILFAAVTLEFSLSLNIFYLLCFVGLAMGVHHRGFLPLTENEKTGLMIVLIFCLISIFTYWINGMPGRGDIYVQGRHGKFLLAIPLYFLFRGYFIPNKVIWILSVLVAMELSVIALVDLGTGVFEWPGRASGNTHPIYFGVESLMMLVLILAFRDDWGQKKWPRFLARAGLLAAFAALIMTGSRSVWLALPAVGLLYLFTRSHQFRTAYVLKVTALVFLASVALLQLPFIKDRWDEAVDEFQSYQSSESADDPARTTSLGARLEMWRAANQMIIDNPLLGVGTGGFQTTAKAYYEAGGWSHDLATRNGPHNQYLNAWASRGIGGLVVSILLLLAPFLYCLRVRKESQFDDVRQLALACMMIAVIFAVTGLSEDVLEKKPLIILYVTSMTLLLGQIRHRSRI